ncbi:MAG: Arm DNA-binding domain-containing protein, partial [Alphaproteobacteria bacterium]|nr:Arm DNA-binding domain-containing protein [Alphaproteobacteria bacterium]
DTFIKRTDSKPQVARKFLQGFSFQGLVRVGEGQRIAALLIQILMDGIERLYSVCVYPEVSVAQARKAKEKARTMVAAGMIRMRPNTKRNASG